MNYQEKINDITKSLREYALNDIHKTIPLNAQLASFILCSCFIDQVSAFYCGFEKYVPPKKAGGKPQYKIAERFIAFCDTYLKPINPEYDSGKLYDDFRCGIVHSYTGEKKFALGRLGDGEHLSIRADGSLLLILETFLNDIELAFNNWCTDIQTEGRSRMNAIKWLDLKGIYKQTS